MHQSPKQPCAIVLYAHASTAPQEPASLSLLLLAIHPKLHLYPFSVRASPPVPLISYSETIFGFPKDPSVHHTHVHARPCIPFLLYCPANQPNFCFLTLGKTPIKVMTAATITAQSLIFSTFLL